MANLFYFFGILFLVYNVMTLLGIRASLNRHLAYKAFMKEHKGEDLSWEDKPRAVRSTTIRILLVTLPFVFWSFTGLLSSQWLLFGLLIVKSLLFPQILKLFSPKPVKLAIYFLSVLLSASLILLIILNRFHLHIDFLSLILR